MTTANTNDDIRTKVRDGYSAIARTGGFVEAPAQSGCCGGGGCCGPATYTADDLAAAIGYSREELAGIPAEANMGLSCGNPTAIASLKPGEVAVDLGSGGGFDCFLAGPKVGASGRIIGIDMTPDMLSKARRNIQSYEKQSGLSNVEFRLGEIEHIPVPDGTADVVISNCVLNLSPDKPQVWREIARILKPGGRVAISDLALLRPLPAAVKADIEALVGCIAGAELVDDTRRSIEAAGLQIVSLEPKPEYMQTLSRSGDPLIQKILAHLPKGLTPADYITSLDITAAKPA
jgi:arsenite methyltransferase